MNILVTGCAGFIGSHMADLLIENGHEVVGIDCFTYAGKASNIQHLYDHPRFKMWNKNICSTAFIKEVCELRDIDWIINFAAESHVDNSIKDVDPFVRSNIQGVISLLDICRSTGTKLLHISTDEVYGSTIDGSFKEDDVLNPKNPYSASKAAAEHFVKSYHNTYNTTYKMVRMSNNFGPRQHNEKLIPTVVRCIENSTKIPVYGNGKNVRDWFYVKDCVKMIYEVLCSGKENEVYNLTHCNELENIDVITTICDIMNVDPSEAITFVDDRPGHDFRYSISNKKVRDLKVSPPTGFQEALRKTVDSLREK
mgnify:CR=1 FL=1|jgi:dTDP-glucose 4,6-dehydratase